MFSGFRCRPAPSPGADEEAGPPPPLACDETPRSSSASAPSAPRRRGSWAKPGFVKDSTQSPVAPLPLPRLSIAILVVGTHGDVLPFVSLAKTLQAEGHRVRIATHAQHRRMVRAYGCEHFPLGGNPVQLSKWMVQSGGTLSGEVLRFEPAKLAMLREVILSLWPAVSAKDPYEFEAAPFLADAIIANPPCIGHVHVAEALGVPLHMMFPQPWLPTRAFPHPMSGLRVGAPPSELNALSYSLAEEALWVGNAGAINAWRRSVLHLPVVQIGTMAGNVTERFRVPFSFLWSPSFVPKPSDWGEHVEVVGNFPPPPSAPQPAGPPGAAAPPEGAEGAAFDPARHAGLRAWLGRSRGAVVFVGFGSMVVEDTAALSATLVQAARASGVRLLVQSQCWAPLATEAPSGGLCHDVGPCPHDWLLPQVDAVVHHGGAGTTAAGLRAGKPTLVVPFFGDQFFWGEMVRRAGVGPPPIPIGTLSAQSLAAALRVLAQPQTRAAAERLAARMAAEDGVGRAVAHFERWLPRQAMLCDACLLLSPPEHRVARFRLSNWRGGHALKLGSEAVAVLTSRQLVAAVSTRGERARASLRWLGHHRMSRWGISRLPGFWSGVLAGLVGFCAELLSGVADLFNLPDDFARRGGCLCCACGVLLLPAVLCLRLLHAIVILADRLVTGAYNSYVRLRDPENGARKPTAPPRAAERRAIARARAPSRARRLRRPRDPPRGCPLQATWGCATTCSTHTSRSRRAARCAARSSSRRWRRSSPRPPPSPRRAPPRCSTRSTWPSARALSTSGRRAARTHRPRPSRRSRRSRPSWRAAPPTRPSST